MLCTIYGWGLRQKESPIVGNAAYFVVVIAPGPHLESDPLQHEIGVIQGILWTTEVTQYYLIRLYFIPLIGMVFIWAIYYSGLYPRDREGIFAGSDFHCVEVDISKLMQQNQFSYTALSHKLLPRSLADFTWPLRKPYGSFPFFVVALAVPPLSGLCALPCSVGFPNWWG